MNITKDTKMLENEERNIFKVSALRSQEVDKQTIQYNQAEEEIFYEKQPILVKSLRRENKTEEKISKFIPLMNYMAVNIISLQTKKKQRF